MKITMYTITDCQFSKQEREYLLAHGLQFEEKNLETNREFLTEMLAVGGNFAGTPVTKIEKDDGQIVVLKGFTAAEFDKTLGLATAAVEPVAPVVAETAPQAPEAQPVPPQEAVAAPVAPPVAEVPVVPAPAAPEVAVTTDPAMASLLNNLQQQAQVAPPQTPVAQPPAAPEAPVPGAPVIPDPQF